MRWTLAGLAFLGMLGATGCTHYTTPAAGVSMASLANVDADIAERFRAEARSTFPATIAVARLQSGDYRAFGENTYGSGKYRLVVVRDLERDNALAALPDICAIAMLNRVVVPDHIETVKDLRLAAASLKADMLLVYTFDTRFRIDEVDLGPLEVITLGVLPNKTARVSTTASAGLFDVRSGFVYGLCESTAHTDHIASSWTQQNAIDQSRVKTEQRAYTQLVEEFGKLWSNITAQYARAGNAYGN